MTERFDCSASMRALILLTAVTVTKLAIVSPALGAQSPGPPDIDTLIGLEHPREAVISPDGGHVAYVVETTNWEENRYDRYIVLASTEAGSEPVRLTRGAASSFRPRFYPDSDSIAFLSDRDGAPQIYRLSLAGGDAQRLTSLDGGVRAFEIASAASVGAGISDWMTYYVNTDIHPFTRQYLSSTPWENRARYDETSPIHYIRNARTPTLIQHGENDRRVPLPNAYELYQGLRDQGVPTRLAVFSGFGHGINKPKANRAVMEQNLAWFEKWIWGGEESSQQH